MARGKRTRSLMAPKSARPPTLAIYTNPRNQLLRINGHPVRCFPATCYGLTVVRGQDWIRSMFDDQAGEISFMPRSVE